MARRKVSAREQHLSIRHTAAASLHRGRRRSVRGHIWLAMTFSALWDRRKRCRAFFRAVAGWVKPCRAVLPADSVPVVEKKVVQQGAADQAFPVHPQAQAAAEPIAVIGDGEAVLQTGDTPVLGEGAHGLHIRTGQKSLGAGIEVQMLVSGEFHEAATSFLSYCMHL